MYPSVSRMSPASGLRSGNSAGSRRRLFLHLRFSRGRSSRGGRFRELSRPRLYRPAVGATLIEFIVWLLLIMVGFTLTFEVLSRYLDHHHRNLGQTRQAGEVIRLRDFFLLHLREGQKGLGLMSRGGALPVAQSLDTGAPCSSVWIGENGKRLCWLERQTDFPVGSLVYTRMAGSDVECLVVGVSDATPVTSPMVLILGLPLPPALESAWANQISLPVHPYHGHRVGWIGQVTGIRPAAPGDVAGGPSTPSLPVGLQWENCWWWRLRPASFPPSMPGIEPVISFSALTDYLLAPEKDITCRVVPLTGWREMHCTPDGGLVSITRQEVGTEMFHLLPSGTLREDAVFRFIGADLSESVTSPPLRFQVGVSFSATCSLDGRPMAQHLYIPIVFEERMPSGF